MTGRFFEDFEPGDVIKHWPGRTIGETDNVWFTLLTMNTHPLHFDAAFSARTEFGKPLVNSCLTLSIVVGMSVSDISQNAVANLGWKDIHLLKPVFVGDTVYAQSTVVDRRPSKSRPADGIVTVETEGHKSTGETFIRFSRSILIPKRVNREE